MRPAKGNNAAHFPTRYNLPSKTISREIDKHASCIREPPMKIGIISDTHGDIQATQQAVRILDSLNANVLLHCGDIGLEILPYLKDIPTHFVLGNMDEPDRLRDALAGTAHTFYEQFGSLDFDGLRVAFLHGNDVQLLYQTIHSGQWDLVTHGHTHSFSQAVVGKTVVLNPGALSRSIRPSLATVDLPSLEITEIAL
jgi:uncharacterized protein